MRTDGRNYRRDEANSRFSQFCERVQKFVISFQSDNVFLSFLWRNTSWIKYFVVRHEMLNNLKYVGYWERREERWKEMHSL
jgi:hypothetical protein